MDLLDNSRAKPATNQSNFESAELQPIGGNANTTSNSQITNQSSQPSSISHAKDIKDQPSRPNVISRPINRIQSINSRGTYKNRSKRGYLGFQN